MKAAGRLVEGTGPDAIGTIGMVIRPEIETGFGIDMPGHDPLTVGDIVRLIRRLAEHNAFAGTFFGALLTNQAKIPHPEFNRFIGN